MSSQNVCGECEAARPRWWVVGVEILVSTLTWENFQLLQRKFNRKTPNIYIANIVITTLDFYGIVSEGASDLEGFKVGRLQ